MSNRDRKRSVLLLVLIAFTATFLATKTTTAVPLAFVQEVQCNVTEPVCILVIPDGSGMTFQEARTLDGEVVDVTVSVLIWLVDEFGPIGPLAGFEAAHLTLQAPNGFTLGCAQDHVSAADHDTDADGWTEFTLAPRAGGWSQELLEIYVVDDPAGAMGSDIPALPIYFNSPDINGDRQVNLSDVVLFAQDFGDPSAPIRSDLLWDGIINLSDLVVLSQHLGVECP